MDDYVVVWKTEDLWDMGLPMAKRVAKQVALWSNMSCDGRMYRALPIDKANELLSQGEWIELTNNPR